MAIEIELPKSLETAVKYKALLSGVSPETYVLQVIERQLNVDLDPNAPVVPYKNSRGILAKYGPAPTAEEIDENRVVMLRNSIFARDAE